MDQNLEQLKKEILQYAQEHHDLFEKVAFDIDEIIDQSVKEYDSAQDRVKDEIINDPMEIKNPEEEMKTRLGIEQKRIEQETEKKLQNYLDDLTKKTL